MSIVYSPRSSVVASPGPYDPAIAPMPVMTPVDPRMPRMGPMGPMGPVMSPMGPMMSPMGPVMSPMGPPLNTRTLVKNVTTRQPEIPFVPSVDFTYSRPSIAMVENLNHDPEVHKKVTKFFYYKVLDKWLYKDLLPLLSYFQVDGKKVSYIKDLDKFDKKAVMKLKQPQVDAIVEYIEDHLLTKIMVNRILHKFVMDSGVNWYDLPNQEGVVREVIAKKLKKNIHKAITGKSFRSRRSRRN